MLNENGDSFQLTETVKVKLLSSSKVNHYYLHSTELLFGSVTNEFGVTSQGIA